MNSGPDLDRPRRPSGFRRSIRGRRTSRPRRRPASGPVRVVAGTDGPASDPRAAPPR